ncbi:MAG: outer membrane protein transport protein [Gallionella sp.]
MKLNKIVVSLFAAGVMASPLAHATNGYFRIGVGDKAESMGGVGIALPQDAMAAATNPAGMAIVGDRVDIGLTWFKPDRSETTTGAGGAMALGTYDGNGRSNFFIPDFGYNKMIKPDMSLGITVYGAGGMNTQYNNNPFGGGASGNPAGVNLSQLFIAPTWAMKVNPNNSVGASLVAVYQMFSATGLQGFDAPGYTATPGSMTNNGTDTSTGVGIRLGWTGQVSDMATLGATYQPKVSMSKFSKYSGLFADQGNFDIPANYGVGVAVKANDATTVGVDVTRIAYSGVPSIGDSPNIFNPGVVMFGSNNGPGFGWKDMTVFKLGVKYALNPGLTLRAGFNHNTQQIPDNAAWLNVLAPGVVQNHLTLGATWALANKSELTVGYVHAFEQTVTGPILGLFGSENVSIKMHEDSIGVTYGW